MSKYLETLKKETQLYLKTLHDDIVARRDKDFFRPTGTQVYVGKQGSGKTVSTVHDLVTLKERYPRSLVVSNLSITGWEPLSFDTEADLLRVLASIDPRTQYVQFHTMEQLAIALVAVNNGFYGVVYVIDEIHTYFNALDSKNIPMYVFTEISQQRKQRKLIIGTSQLFLRIAKPFREQCDNIIVCKTYLGVFTVQHAYEGETLEQDYNGKLKGKKKKTGWFFQTREIRKMFDTYQKVVSGHEQYENNKPMEITLKNKKLSFK